MDRVGQSGQVTERVAGGLGVRVHRVRVAMSLVHGALGPRSGGSVSYDSRGHAGCCVVTKLVAWQRAQKRNTRRPRLLDVGCIRYRTRWIRI